MRLIRNHRSIVFLLSFSYVFLFANGSDVEADNIKSPVGLESDNGKVENSQKELGDENARGICTCFLDLIYEIPNATHRVVIFLGNRLTDSLGDSEGSSQTLLLLINSTIGCLVMYVLVKMFSPETSRSSKLLADALARTRSEASELELEAKTMMEELERLEKELEAKQKEEEEMNFEKDELKIKMDEVKSEREKLAKESAKMGTKLAEEVGKLEELKQKRNAQGKQNKALKEELSNLKKDKKMLEEDNAKKESELASPREAVLKQKHERMISLHSSLLQDKDKLTEKLKDLVKSLSELRQERERLEKEGQEDLKRLEHLSEENKLLDSTLKGAQGFEDGLGPLRRHENVDDEKEEEKLLVEFVDKSLAREKLRMAEEELELLRNVLESERGSSSLVEVDVRRARSDLELLTEALKKTEKSSKAASIKLDVLKSHFEEREGELTSKLGKLEEREYQVLDDCQLKEKINQHMRLVHRYKTDVEVLQKDIEVTEAGYKEKISALEKKAQDCWISSRRTESNSKALQQEVDSLSAQLNEALEELREVDDKLASKMPMPPRPMMPLPRMPIFPMFPRPMPPPPPGMFRPADLDGSNAGSSLRSTPFGHPERPYGPSPAPVFRPLMENASTPSTTPGSRNPRPTPQQQQLQQPQPQPSSSSLQSRRADF